MNFNEDLANKIKNYIVPVPVNHKFLNVDFRRLPKING